MFSEPFYEQLAELLIKFETEVEQNNHGQPQETDSQIPTSIEPEAA